MTTSILVGSTEISSLDTTCPKNETCRSQNSHLENLAYNLFSLKIVRLFGSVPGVLDPFSSISGCHL